MFMEILSRVGANAVWRHGEEPAPAPSGPSEEHPTNRAASTRRRDVDCARPLLSVYPVVGIAQGSNFSMLPQTSSGLTFASTLETTPVGA